MKQLFFIIGLTLQLVFAGSLLAQPTPTVMFNYDDDGNRTSVTYILIRVDDNKSPDVATFDNTNSTESISLSVYPNPTTGQIVVAAENYANSQDITARLVSIQGYTIEEKALVSDHTEFDVTQSPAGTYFLYIEYNNKKQIWKIIKR